MLWGDEQRPCKVTFWEITVLATPSIALSSEAGSPKLFSTLIWLVVPFSSTMKERASFPQTPSSSPSPGIQYSS